MHRECGFRCGKGQPGARTLLVTRPNTLSHTRSLFSPPRVTYVGKRAVRRLGGASSSSSNSGAYERGIDTRIRARDDVALCDTDDDVEGAPKRARRCP